ncbi:glycosyl transferase family protein [Roseobacter sp. A03A-229]
MMLGDYVRILGRGPGRSRALEEDEAHAAMQLMLSGAAAPEAIGALLMLLRMKGETAPEIAGFARAAQEGVPELPEVDLDWPSYAAGRTRGLPWFLLSAKLVAGSGRRVLLHGWNGADPAVRDGLAFAGIGIAHTAEDAHTLIARDGIAYLPLERLAPNLFALLNLRAVLGLRSCINTISRMLNPARAPASVQGVFHPSYRLLQADAAALLGWQALTVIKGGGGEFERHPSKSTLGFGLRAGAMWQCDLPAQHDDVRRLDDGRREGAALAQMWQGTLRDPFAEDIILGTAELALDTLGVEAPRQTARRIWANRDHVAAA